MDSGNPGNPGNKIIGMHSRVRLPLGPRLETICVYKSYILYNVSLRNHEI